MEKNIEKGLITELIIQQAFVRLGCDVSIPLYNASKYDMIIDNEGKLFKVQVKTSRQEGFRIIFNCYTTHPKGKKKKFYTSDEVDLFATYWNGKIFIIPFSETEGRTIYSLPLDDEEHLIENFFSKKMSTDEELYSTEQIKYCCDCGKPITKSSTRCNSCSAKHRVKIKTEMMTGSSSTDLIFGKVDRAKLKELIRTTPFTQIGSIYGVSDNAVRKWCDSYGLPRTKAKINEYTEEQWAKL